MIKKQPLITIAIFIAISFWQCTSPIDVNPAIEKEKLKEHVYYLAAEELAGRYPATKGDTLAARYIAAQFQNTGLKLLANNGWQTFTIPQPAVVNIQKPLTLDQENAPLADSTTFSIYPISSTGSPAGKVQFCGYANNPKVDSKKEGAAWAALVIAEGEEMSGQSLRSLFIDAKNTGYEGVMVLHPWADSSFAFSTHKLRGGETGIVSLEVSPQLSKKLLELIHVTEEDLQNEPVPSNAISEKRITLEVKRHTPVAYTQNVVATAIVDTTKPYIVVGAHYDHLGMGGVNSGSRQPNTKAIHPGADDNASGVAALLEMAERVQFSKDSLQKNFLFVAFGAEEKGLLGSKHFVENLPVPKEKIALMINLDMLGRMKPDSSLQIGGVGTFDYAETLLNEQNTDSLNLGISTEGYGPSDHAVFYSASIPVLFFSTGAHLDYHTAADTAGALNYECMTLATQYITSVAMQVASSDSMYTFREAGPMNPQEQYKHGERYKVTLGIMPDFSGVVKKGLRADVVIKGKPAYKAGMKNGDIIVAINSKPVKDIYEYMTLLGDLKPGETVIVDVLRNDEKEVLLVQL